MTATIDILRGELERLFELDDMKQLSSDLLGIAPDEVGATSGKGAFARALVERCSADDALPALADAIVLVKKGMKEGLDLYVAPSEELAAGTVVGGFKIQKKLGEGGIGVVYLAEKGAGSNGAAAKDGADGEKVALKVLRAVYAKDRAAAKRWLTAARAVARIDERGIGRIVATGELEDGRPWVATEHVDGQSLAARLSRTGPMHFNEARPIVRGALAALEAMHAKGMAHGGVKSENVFMLRPSASDKMRNEPSGLLVDPGADRLFARPPITSAERSGIVPLAGTPKTFAPEQARLGRAVPSGDLYALGVVLYEALTGRAPFTGETAIDVIAQHLTAEPAAPSTHAPRGWVARELDEIVLKALAKDPAARYQSAQELREALESIGRASIPPAARKKEELDQAAFEKAKAALLDAPTDESLAAQLEQLVDAAQEWGKAAEVFTEAAAKVEDVEAKKSLLFRVARLNETDLGDAKAAEVAYRKILEVDPEDEIARVALEELKRQTGDAEGLVELLLEKSEREEVPSERAQILREIAETYEKQLGDADNAFVAWVQALTDEPRDERAQREIERLASGSTERWNEALTALNEAVQASEDRDARIALYVLMGRWYAERLGRPDFALPCFGQALALDPASDAALDGTVELYRKAQSWQELAQILLRRAEVATSQARARDFLAEAAEIVHRRLGDGARAAEIFEKVLEADPAHPKATDALETLYSERKDWPALVALLEKKAESQRGEEKAETLAAIAEVYEDRIADGEKSITSYQKALAIAPRHLGALKGLERILAQKGRFAELLENLRAQLEAVATPRQKISILERVGSIQEEEFVEHAKAAETYEQIVAIEPGHDGANAALARLYRQLHRFDDLAATLERHAKGSADDARKIGLLLQASKVLMVDVGAPDRAISVAERVLAIDSKHAEALDFVARLRAQTGDVRAALEAVERLADSEREPAKKAELFVRAARILEDSGDKDGAIARYKSALDADSNNAAAASALRSIYAGRGDAHGAAEILLREIAVTSGASAQAKLYADLGFLRRDRLKEPAAATEAFKKALELDATCTPAARGLGDVAFDANDFKEAAKHYEPLLARTSEMTKEVARDVSVRCGDAFRKLSQFDKAQRAYLNAKAFAPEDREVLERVAAVTFDAGEADEAAELYRDILAKFGKDLVGTDRGNVLYRFGEALRRSEQLDEAASALEEATQHLPGAAEPLDALKQLFATKGDWEKVIKTLRRRMESASDDDRFALLVETGDVLLQKLGDKQRAGKSYVAALELKGDDRNLLTKLMAVYSETRDWGKLVEVILRIADLVEDPAQLAKYYNTAAAISHFELKRLDEAADYYEQALEHSPLLAKAFEGLVSALTEKTDWTRLESAYRNRIKKLEGLGEGKRPSREELAHLWDALGELLKHRLNRASDAVDAFDQAQKLEPTNRRRAEQLAEIYAAEPKRWFSKAVSVHQQLLTLSPYRIESYQALRKLYTEGKKPDESWCLCQALTALKNAEPDEEAFFKKHRSRKPLAAKDPMSEDAWAKLVMHPDQDPLLTDIFTTIAPAVIAVRSQPLSAFRLDASKKRDAKSDSAEMARSLHHASQVTRIALPELYYRDDDAGGLSFVFASPVAVGLGKGARAGGPAQALSFVAARHLAFTKGGMVLRHLVPTGSGLRAWLLAAIKSVVPQFPIPGDLASSVEEHMGAFKKHLSGPQQETLRSLVQKLLSAAPELDLKRWTAAVDLTADRIGFIVANDLEIASALVRASPEESSAVPQKDRLRELHLYSVSEQYLALRHKLGVAIGD
ncbi:protein kinase domain-containing protein [Sandaracinus amylolyticus]|uniref:Serine/threonine protein kinase n=1 Tax=Sandaracinus amylolyticus TaxID=927083 RepID=A0A0F6W7E1_9BACT|nr:protein kinase [Sandaracinus amylolyticus]AKF09165.1 serine/threonine protein kinase [Sandaracinus amylolyticus]